MNRLIDGAFVENGHRAHAHKVPLEILSPSVSLVPFLRDFKAVSLLGSDGGRRQSAVADLIQGTAGFAEARASGGGGRSHEDAFGAVKLKPPPKRALAAKPEAATAGATERHEVTLRSRYYRYLAYASYPLRCLVAFAR